MQQNELVAIIHIVGFVTGIALYGMLGLMTLRRTAATNAAVRAWRIPLATAVLGVAWNLGALIVYGSRDFGLGSPHPLLFAVAGAALGFLPAVVIHAATHSLESPTLARVLTLFGYILSTSAGIALIGGASGAAIPSRVVFQTLSIGYGLVIVLVLGASAVVPGAIKRSVAAVALAAFAFSSFHLSQHPVAESALTAIVGDHASIPLAIVILYQDWRFAFADRFLRRAIALVGVVAVALTLHISSVNVLAGMAEPASEETVPATVLHVALLVTTALLYAPIRRGSDWLVDRVILRRPDYTKVRQTLVERIANLGDEGAIVDTACTTVKDALGAGSMTRQVTELVAPATFPIIRERPDTGAVVHVPAASGAAWNLEISALGGGRRLLSDDRRFLEQVALTVGRRIDALRADSHRIAHAVREQELAQMAAEAELRALRAQLNPHFLFNTLTTIGYLIASSPERALKTLYRLTDLLRAVLRPSKGDLVPLSDELELVSAYLAIEQERFEERLQVHIDVPHDLLDAQVLSLLLQPVVENAVKHGIAPRRMGGDIHVTANRTQSRDGRPQLMLVVFDSGGTFASTTTHRRGVGLDSVRGRLERLFGTGASVSIESNADIGTTVTLVMPLIMTGEPARTRHQTLHQHLQKE